MRLARFLAQAGLASRRRAEDLIAAGRVRVRGEVTTAPGARVDLEKDRVEVDGRRVRPEAPLHRLMLKPRECLATLEERPGRPTLRRYLPHPEPGLRVVAPLDYPAEGLVLLTTDGDLAEAIARRSRVPMTYHVKLQGQAGDAEVGRLLRGWRFDGRRVRPRAAALLASTGKNTWIEMVIAEPRARALKAAGDAVRHAVLKISRVRFGALSFEGLKMGGWRDLGKEEVAGLRRAAGMDPGR